MRIISGSHKGRKIIAPKKLPVRPTTDFAKEGLFNILRNRIDFSDISVLDLFAGTGNIAYEFASRGCVNITCVDAHRNCIRFIEKTAQILDFPIETLIMDVFVYAQKYQVSYDIIFADPPYDMAEEDFIRLIDLFCSNQHLENDGFMIVEHPKHKDFSSHPKFSQSRKYGSSIFSFFKM